jgi:hypothetical protein
MTITLTEKAVAGRRVTLTYHRDLPNGPKQPGIITHVDPTQTGAAVWIRLDGTRYNLHARHDYQGLQYLDDIVPVPELPMGPFQPTAGDMLGVWEGVPMSTIGEDGEDLILLTADREKAIAAAAAYDRDSGLDVESVNYQAIQARWAVFEWEPEDAERPWTVNLHAAEGDEHAIQLYYLPA